jgi:ketosteroid isomerase-like protein
LKQRLLIKPKLKRIVMVRWIKWVLRKSASSPQACMTAFVDSMIRRDLDAALSLLTDDVAFFYSNGSALWGKEAFAATMTANWKLIDRYNYTTLDAIWLAQSETVAAVIYTFSWSGVAGGRDVDGSGRGTRIFRRDRAGWRIAHEHLSVGDWKPSQA